MGIHFSTGRNKLITCITCCFCPNKSALQDLAIQRIPEYISRFRKFSLIKFFVSCKVILLDVVVMVITPCNSKIAWCKLKKKRRVRIPRRLTTGYMIVYHIFLHFSTLFEQSLQLIRVRCRAWPTVNYHFLLTPTQIPNLFLLSAYWTPLDWLFPVGSWWARG